MSQINCVLLIDDNETTSFINRLLIERLKISEHLLMAQDGRSALNLLQERLASGAVLPDLILLDIKMPGMDGFEFFSAFKEKPEYASCLTVMLTTSQNARDLEQAKALGIPYFLTKPLTPQKITDIIQLHFQSKQATGNSY
ncbi:response regulator [Adhaeribacter pallidiroseus]|uniref:Putative methanoproteinis regulatory protein FilR2 n=1 Tax=Adhaeribacter pallidiroseus TaxID=2072847 RepID=A0A369QH24_9BACT|nr:response regulator [Adhaeribacter pallidiroseus]RDC62567.1 putative methanoproteinis regulatory protein FilR2 [Adhaeribacter pallidiroseus]